VARRLWERVGCMCKVCIDIETLLRENVQHSCTLLYKSGSPKAAMARQSPGNSRGELHS